MLISGCFLSKSAAPGYILVSIILEALILMEKAGFQCDAICTDGATWNRSMWSDFGATPDSPYTEHPYDETRRLYFISDFPHLIKTLWHWVVKQDEFKVRCYTNYKCYIIYDAYVNT